MPVDSLNCPNCGAPLQGVVLPPQGSQTLAVCLYCSSVVRFQWAESETQTTVERNLPLEGIEPIKQLLLAGQRAEALQRYQQMAGIELTAAEQEIEALARGLSFSTLRQQQLTRYGKWVVGISILAFLAVIIAGLQGVLHPIGVLLLIAIPLLQLIFFTPGLLATLRFMFAPTAPAVTLNYAHIGLFKTRKMDIHTYRVWLEVQPVDRAPFQTELVLPVKEENLPRLKQGARILVKYIPGQPGNVVFDKSLG